MPATQIYDLQGISQLRCTSCVQEPLYWADWFTFLSQPEVNPDNNDAVRVAAPLEQRGLRPRGDSSQSHRRCPQ